MRVLKGLAGLVLLVAALGLAACDSTQPLQAQQQTAQISFTAVNALTRTYNVWDMYEDADGDTLPDDVDGDGVGDLYLFCQEVFGQPLTAVSVPWRFSVEISIIRAGGTVREVLTEDAALNLEANLSNYDTNVQFNLTAAKNPITVTDGMVTRTFLFDNTAAFGPGPRRLTAANRDVVLAVDNPLAVLEPVTYGQGRGLCSSNAPGPAVLDGAPPPFEVILDKGDTLIIQARRGEAPPEMIFVDPDTGATSPLIQTEPVLDSALIVDGRAIDDFIGTATTEATVGAPLSYTFTTR